jgi:hypothetical protein
VARSPNHRGNGQDPSRKGGYQGSIFQRTKSQEEKSRRSCFSSASRLGSTRLDSSSGSAAGARLGLKARYREASLGARGGAAARRAARARRAGGGKIIQAARLANDDAASEESAGASPSVPVRSRGSIRPQSATLTQGLVLNAADFVISVEPALSGGQRLHSRRESAFW